MFDIDYLFVMPSHTTKMGHCNEMFVDSQSPPATSRIISLKFHELSTRNKCVAFEIRISEWLM